MIYYKHDKEENNTYESFTTPYCVNVSRPYQAGSCCTHIHADGIRDIRSRFNITHTCSQNATKFVVRKSGFGRKIQLWDTTKVRLQYNLNGHGFASDWWRLVNAFSPDEKMVAVTSPDHPIGSIHLWDIANPSKSLLGRIFNPKSIQPKYTFQGNQQKVKALAFSPNGKILASSGDSLDINLWSTESGKKTPLMYKISAKRSVNPCAH